MLASLVVAAVLTLALGVAAGWAARGRVAHWCTVHGEPLICNTCRPHPAIGRAAVRWQAQPASTVDRARPLMTRAAENRAPRISRRSI